MNHTPLAAAGGNPQAQLRHLKAHLAFQAQDKCDKAQIDWATTITRAQSRRHITSELQKKINSKIPDFHGPGKLDSPEGQEALQTTREYVRMRSYHGGNGFHLIGWNLRYRMYRERTRRRGLCEEAFWDIANEERNNPRLRPKEQEFPEEIRYRLQLRRMVESLIQEQGANPRHHKSAVRLETHLCPRSGEHVTAAQAGEKGQCPHCARRLDQFSLTARAFDPGEQPALIGPGTWRRQPHRRTQAGRTARPWRNSIARSPALAA